MHTAHRSVPRLFGATGVVLALVIASAGCSAGNQPGKVLFSPTLPTSGQCVPSNAVTTVSASASVYGTFNFQSKPQTAVTLEITKDGTSILKGDSTAGQGLDCLADTTDLSKVPGWGPGTITETATLNGTVIASGTLTVTP